MHAIPGTPLETILFGIIATYHGAFQIFQNGHPLPYALSHSAALARGREHCRGEPGGSLSGGYAPDSAKAEGSSIVDEPGEG